MKAPGEPLHSLTPEQVRVGTKQIMTYAERQAFWRNSDVGKQLGFEQWGKQSESEKNFVSNLSKEKWLGNKNQDNLINEPNWDQIEAAIRELDGANHTLVTLGADEETYMSIGGGAGKYVVTVTFDNLDFYMLVDSSKPNDIEKLVIGGQAVNYPANQCIDLLRCLLAARTFALEGKLDQLLTWIEDKSLAAA
ncbi:hypothetical protein NIES4071_18850 [Calothrix sp. NIES-4071]|nr:hypothetical protein NIES4071_18850 [Calothrix sp. NIES-4071]BAZ56218.1 hypothetical protein NIES4105_18800 [Calothrix sp. NIES-4105]